MNPPAFQFYPDDFISGTCDLSATDVGVYIRLLCYQWSRGSIPVKDITRLERIGGASVSDDVLVKFPRGKNARMESVRKKQDEYRAMQSVKGIASAKARLNRGSTVVQPRCQPEANFPSPSPSPSPLAAQTNTSRYPKLEEVKAVGAMRGLPESECEQFWHHFESTGWIDKNGHAVANWQSKLMTWKVKSQASAFQAKAGNGAIGESNPTVLLIRDQNELDRVEKRVQTIKGMASHDAVGAIYSDAQKAELSALSKRKSELKTKLGFIV